MLTWPHKSVQSSPSPPVPQRKHKCGGSSEPPDPASVDSDKHRWKKRLLTTTAVLSCAVFKSLLPTGHSTTAAPRASWAVPHPRSPELLSLEPQGHRWLHAPMGPLHSPVPLRPATCSLEEWPEGGQLCQPGARHRPGDCTPCTVALGTKAWLGVTLSLLLTTHCQLPVSETCLQPRWCVCSPART